MVGNVSISSYWLIVAILHLAIAGLALFVAHAVPPALLGVGFTIVSLSISRYMYRYPDKYGADK